MGRRWSVGIGRRPEVGGMGRKILMPLDGQRSLVHERIAVGSPGGLVGTRLLVLLERVELRILLEGLPRLRRRRWMGSFGLDSGIMPLHFGPAPAIGIPYSSTIIEVTPNEFRKIQSHELKLPEGWEIGEELPKPAENTGGV